MTRVQSALERALRDLAACRARVALVGGLAVSARTEPRFTRDVDLAIAIKGDAEAEALVRALIERGYRVFAVAEHETAKRLATARLVGPSEDAEGVVVDLLFASSGVEPEIVSGAEMLEVFEGVNVPVATIPALLATKILARDDRRRPQDAQDLRALLACATDVDLEEADRLLTTVTQRGFARNKDLSAELRRAITDFR